MAVDPLSAVTPVQIRSVSLLDALREGQTLEAKVSAMVSQTLARLTIGTQTLDVATTQALPVGATLVLKAERGPDGLNLVVQNPAAAQIATTARPAVALPTINPTPPTSTPGGAATATPQPAASSPAPAPLAAQTSAALFASPQVLASVTLPRTPATGRPAPLATDAIRPAEALAGSDTVSDMPNPAASEANSLADERAAGQARTAPQASDPRLALVQMQRQAADKQASLSGLFANLAALKDQADNGQRPGLPAGVIAGAKALLAMRLDGNAPVSADAVKQAIGQSGLFLESRLSGLASGLNTSAPTPDLKSGLMALLRQLGDGPDALATPQPHDRPPVKGALPQGQPPREALLAASLPDKDALATLRHDSEAALARISLSQAASLTEGAANPARPGQPPQPPVLHLEIPVQIAQHTAIMQMQIRPDPDDTPNTPRRAAPGGGWSVRFAMEAEPLGPVHAAITLREAQAGPHIGVQLWAERPAATALFASAAPQLKEALEASQFTVDGLTVSEGRPGGAFAAPTAAPVARPGHVDVSS